MRIEITVVNKILSKGSNFKIDVLNNNDNDLYVELQIYLKVILIGMAVISGICCLIFVFRCVRWCFQVFGPVDDGIDPKWDKDQIRAHRISIKR